MHDGSAPTPPDAIAQHRGEAGGVRQRYEALEDTNRQKLLAFLNSL